MYKKLLALSLLATISAASVHGSDSKSTNDSFLPEPLWKQTASTLFTAAGTLTGAEWFAKNALQTSIVYGAEAAGSACYNLGASMYGIKQVIPHAKTAYNFIRSTSAVKTVGAFSNTYAGSLFAGYVIARAAYDVFDYRFNKNVEKAKDFTDKFVDGKFKDLLLKRNLPFYITFFMYRSGVHATQPIRSVVNCGRALITPILNAK